MAEPISSTVEEILYQPNPSSPLHSHSHSDMGMIPEYTNTTHHLQELGQNSDTSLTNPPQINQNKNMGFVANCSNDNTQITNFADFPKSDPFYDQEAQISDTQMTNFADFAESDPFYGQEAQKNDTQMTNFADFPESDPLYGQEAQKNDTQMTNFADFAESDPLYGQEAQKNDTQMTHFADFPKSDPFYDQEAQKNDTQMTNFANFPKSDSGFGGNVKKQKRVRKRGKGAKNDSACDFVRMTVCDCDKRGDRARVAYLKDEIVALRYVGVEEQKKKWSEVYCGLGDVVAKEYDCLVGFNDGYDGDGNYVSFDPRTQFGDKKGAPSGNEPDNNGGELQNTQDVEEDYYEDEYSDSEFVSIQRPAFYVTGEPDFDSGPPQDGLEFLRRVRWETEHVPKVKVAKVDKKLLNKEQTVYMPNIPDIAACPEHLMPSKEWEDVFLADFSKLRLALSENEGFASTISGILGPIPLAHNIIENVIQENLDSYQTDDGTVLMQENLDFIPTDDKTTTIHDLPTLQTIMDMEPVARVSMLRKRITSMETLSSLGRTDCAWLFALCAAIDTPLDADTSASLRCLLRKCAALRAEKTCLDDEVIMLNILATISGKYFGQLQSS